jgi:hypothetical protein
VGWCSEFGVEIASCDHPMVAGADACHCDVCGARCEGRFNGCPDVWARGPVQVDFVRYASSSTKGNGASAAEAHVEQRDEPGEVLDSLRRLEKRLDALEITVLDGQTAVAQREVAELLEKLPSRLGQEIRAALDDREDASTQRLDDTVARLLDAVVALDVSANSSHADGARTQRRRRARAGD